eukprot:SAG31_NODE_24497_length_480_cov_0.876640_1_plen_88_part_00
MIIVSLPATVQHELHFKSAIMYAELSQTSHRRLLPMLQVAAAHYVLGQAGAPRLGLGVAMWALWIRNIFVQSYDVKPPGVPAQRRAG